MNLVHLIASRVLAVILACTSILSPLNSSPLAEEGESFSNQIVPHASADKEAAPSADVQANRSAAEPIAQPTAAPTVQPTEAPTAVPTEQPTAVPTERPTEAPTAVPTEQPTVAPTTAPTEAPTQQPTAIPTAAPTEAPTPSPEPPKSVLDQYDHTTSIYDNDNETLLRVEYYDSNNKLTHYSVVSDFDSATSSYTEKIYTYDDDTQTEILQRTDTYVNGVLDKTK